MGTSGVRWAVVPPAVARWEGGDEEGRSTRSGEVAGKGAAVV